ncbi:site-specific integrase [Paucidesulfovibrio gracilis]|nr:site-specific integrase [Paucidesulfovibrio gracilis]
MPKLDRRELARMIKVYFHKELEGYEDAALELGPYTPNGVLASLESLADISEQVQDCLARKDFSWVKKSVDEFIKDNTLDVPEDTLEYRRVSLEIMKANFDILAVLYHQQHGDYPKTDALLDKYAVADTQQVQAAPAVKEEPGITLFELIDKFCAFKVKMGQWTGRGIKENPKKFSKLKFILGDVKVSSINSDTAMDVFDCFQRLPLRLDAKRYKGLPVDEVISMEHDKKLSVKTINLHMESTSGLFKKAIQWDHVDRDYFAGLRLSDDESDDEKRLPFETEHLRTIFAPEPFWENCKKGIEQFWLPVLALFTGARMEELAQLWVEDVYEMDGVLVLDINDNGTKRLKNKTARRKIPLVDFVRHDLGYEEFVKVQGKAGHQRILPHLPYTQMRYGHKPSRDFNRYLRKMGFKKEHVFHSFRHTVIDSLRNKDIRDDVIASMTGHSNGANLPIPKNYKGHHKVSFIVEKVLPHVGYDIDLSHLIDWKERLKT